MIEDICFVTMSLPKGKQIALTVTAHKSKQINKSEQTKCNKTKLKML